MGEPMVACRDTVDRALVADVDEPEIPRTKFATVNRLSHVGWSLNGERIACSNFTIYTGTSGAESTKRV
jgi:hypothetical protein